MPSRLMAAARAALAAKPDPDSYEGIAAARDAYELRIGRALARASAARHAAHVAVSPLRNAPPRREDTLAAVREAVAGLAREVPALAPPSAGGGVRARDLAAFLDMFRRQPIAPLPLLAVLAPDLIERHLMRSFDGDAEASGGWSTADPAALAAELEAAELAAAGTDAEWTQIAGEAARAGINVAAAIRRAEAEADGR